VTNFENRKPDTVNETTGFSRERGFTMIEVMIVLVVVAILVTVAAPGFQNLIGNNRIISEVYTLRATLNNARSEAMARRAQVVVCPSVDGAACADSDDWSTGYIAFVDTDRDNVADPDDPDEEIIQVEAEERAVDIAFNNAVRLVRFNAQGVALGFDGAFTFCDDRGAEDARALIVNPVGTVRSARDTDTPEDYIVDDGAGDNVTCN
tara:strand:- start:70510 stop:71130 length:621 start_codon:yes stop_codon:yes gene_type:complete